MGFTSVVPAGCKTPGRTLRSSEGSKRQRKQQTTWLLKFLL